MKNTVMYSQELDALKHILPAGYDDTKPYQVTLKHVAYTLQDLFRTSRTL